ncbi:MAG: hypothetical protein AAF289_03545 [Cyanobacteria bacterium P01_A01_bin.135]
MSHLVYISTWKAEVGDDRRPLEPVQRPAQPDNFRIHRCKRDRSA